MTGVDDLHTGPGQVERDQYGRPLINGEPYLRASSLKEQLNDDFAITRWKLQELTLGLGMRRDLWMRAATLGPEDRDQLQEIVDAALAMVDGNTFADFGTSIHNYLQRGLHKPDDLPEVHRAAECIRGAMGAAGLRLIDDTHEVFVVNHTIKAAGSQDGLCVDEAGTVMVWDIKTSKRVDRLAKYKPQQWAVQESVYANATHLVDGSPVPAGVSTDWGIVCYVDRSSGACKVFRVDLNLGYKGARIARDAYDFKATPVRAIAKQLAYFELPATEDLTEVLAESLELVRSARAEAEGTAIVNRVAEAEADEAAFIASVAPGRGIGPDIGRRIGEHHAAVTDVHPDLAETAPDDREPAEPGDEILGGQLPPPAPCPEAVRCDGCSSSTTDPRPAKDGIWTLCPECWAAENPPVKTRKPRKPREPKTAPVVADVPEVEPNAAQATTGPDPEPVAVSGPVLEGQDAQRAADDRWAEARGDREREVAGMVTQVIPGTVVLDEPSARQALERFTESRRAQIKAALQVRVDAIKEAGHGPHLGKEWADLDPRVPTFKTDHEHTLEELQRITDIIWTVETAHTMPFPDDAPLEATAALLPNVIPQDPDGGPLAPELLAAIKGARAALNDADRAWVERMTGPTTKPTRRRGLVMQAAIRLAGADDEVVIAFIEAARGAPLDRRNTVWPGILGTLNLDEAGRLSELAGDNAVGIRHRADGTAELTQGPF